MHRREPNFAFFFALRIGLFPFHTLVLRLPSAETSRPYPHMLWTGRFPPFSPDFTTTDPVCRLCHEPLQTPLPRGSPSAPKISIRLFTMIPSCRRSDFLVFVWPCNLRALLRVVKDPPLWLILNRVHALNSPAILQTEWCSHQTLPPPLTSPVTTILFITPVCTLSYNSSICPFLLRSH